MFFTQLQVFAPVWIYAAIATAVAIHLHHWIQAAIMIIANLVLISAASRWYMSTIRHHGTDAFLGKWAFFDKCSNLIGISLQNGFVKPVFSFALFHLFIAHFHFIIAFTSIFALVHFNYAFFHFYFAHVFFKNKSIQIF
jgi:hypothetical protein